MPNEFRLRRAREILCLTMAELSKFANVRIATISDIERGVVSPQARTVGKLKRALRATVQQQSGNISPITARDRTELSEILGEID